MERDQSGKKEGSMSIAERRAAWRGIDRSILPPRVNTARFRTNGGGSSPVGSSPVIRSPCLVIPPGLSPAALLDSPVPFQGSNNPTDNSNPPISEIQETNNSNSNESEPNKTENSLVKKTLEDGYNWRKYGQKHVKGCEYPRNYYKCTYPNCNVKKMVEQSVEGHITDIVYKGNHEHPLPDSSNSKICNQRGYISKRCMELSPCISSVSEISDSGKDQNALGVGDSMSCVERSGLCCNDEEDDDERESKRRKNEGYLTNIVPASETTRDPRVVVQTISEIDLLDDGYKWRKYGQKVVKGNPNPRSYYKCTCPGCPVRKHIERAPRDLKSVITTYEGKHNHEVPVTTNINNTNNNHKFPSNNNYAQISMQPDDMQSYEGMCLSNFNLSMPHDFGNLPYLELLRPLIDQAFVDSRVTEYRNNYN